MRVNNLSSELTALVRKLCVHMKSALACPGWAQKLIDARVRV